jgi:putative transposase
MTDINVEEILKNLNLSKDTIQLIHNIRNSEPSRKVGSNGKNVPGFYPSKKMGLTIQFESHKLELAGIYEKEHDKKVIEYYDQPPSFTIKYENLKGAKKKSIGHRYTADFFVIEENWIGWEEWKSDEDLIKLSQKNLNRYCVDENGNWRCPPAEAYAQSMGLSFRIRSSKDIDWTYQRNLRFLEDYLLEEKPYVSDDASNMVLKLIGDKPSISLDELLSSQAVYTADDIFTMIANGQIYVDLFNYLIVDFEGFPLFKNEDTFHAYLNLQKALTPLQLKPETLDVTEGNKIQWDSKVWTIINIGEKVLTLFNEDQQLSELPKSVFEQLIVKGSIKGIKQIILSDVEKEAEEIFSSAGEKDLESANRKFIVVRGMIEGASYSEFDVPERTIRDWLKKYRNAENIYGNGYIGLLSKKKNQGNRSERLQTQVKVLMEKYIKDNYETIVQKKRRTVYNAFKEECKLKGYSYPTYKTFCKKVSQRPIYMQTLKRQGSKAAYKFEPFYFELMTTTPVHGDRPFEICHIDHTELDIELVCSQTGENLGKPWITFLVDAFSRRILAFYLTFDEPSYRSCMMVLRECVKIHNRLPYTIVVDGGKEFHSVYFDTLLARYNCKKKIRPGAKPKFGSVCERLFGTTNVMFIHNLLGNTKIMKNVRQVTKEVNPKVHAVWTLEDLFLMMDKWCYEVYDTTPHSALNDSPKEYFIKRIAKTGERKKTFIRYDETFTMLTLPTTKHGTAKVQTGNGVKINYFYYWAEELLHPDVEETKVPVRYDPFNLGKAYAYVGNYWVSLTSNSHATLSGLTEKQLKIVTAEIRKKNKIFGLKREMSSSQIVAFLNSAEAYECLGVQKAKDEALKATFKVIDGGKNKVTEIQKNQENPPKEKNVSGKKETLTESPRDSVLKRMKENNSFHVYKEL